MGAMHFGGDDSMVSMFHIVRNTTGFLCAARKTLVAKEDSAGPQICP